MGRCCRWLLWLIISVASGLVYAAEPAQIRIASETWEGHTHADGSGMAWEIFRAVFEPAGVQLDIQSVPYTRSIGLVQRGAADAWAGSYLNEVTQGVFYPRWNYDADQIAALGLRDKPIPSLDSSAITAWSGCAVMNTSVICQICASTAKCCAVAVSSACWTWAMWISISTP